ncbi:hypothetical protein RchiOBHm_Chr7g0235731 [Rosa chinensis]|uniref:Uncharacterized protein n=1 Tax=Rosa chinensis TaxID=74649 RepID=A0A2P6PGR7_ROSCH|nr:hypothetical protein RchiOBHm_Chr7g0235731 [Rosa chinensis]
MLSSNLASVEVDKVQKGDGTRTKPARRKAPAYRKKFPSTRVEKQ